MTNQKTDSEPEDVLRHSLIHKVLLFFHIPAGWPAWRMVLGSLLLAGGVALLWWPVDGGAGTAALAGLILLAFLAADGLLFWRLPAWGVSYGPWQSQLFALALPRAAAAVLVLPLLLIAEAGWALVVLLAVELLGTAFLLWGTLVEPFRLRLTDLHVETDLLDTSARPIRILHISDLHVERLTRREENLLRLVQEAEAELILITGDYLNLSYTRDGRAHADVRKLLGQLSAPYGVYASLGSPPVDERDVVPALFEDLDIELLVDQWQVVDLGPDRRLVLLGVDCSHHLPTDAGRLERLVSILPNSMPSVLLYHAPDLMPEAAGHGIDLYLCGHTHGGQVRLPFVGALLTSSQLGKRYEMGLYQEGRTSMYVSRGVGLEGLSAPRVRFLAPPEITRVTVKGTG